MSKTLSYLLFVLVFYIVACNKHRLATPDIVSGLVAKIPLNGDAIEEISGVTGNVFRTWATANRHNEADKAMYFNRSDSAYIDFGNLASTSFTHQEFTLCCWVKFADTVLPSAIISKRNVFGPFEYSIDNHFDKQNLCFDNWVADGSTTVYGTDPLEAYASVQLDKWMHLAFVGNTSNVKVYLNGKLQNGADVKKAGNHFVNTNAHFVIGNGGGYNKNYFFNGSIDDVYIYNIALTSEKIRYLAQL